MKIIFFGNADFGIPALNKILSSKENSLLGVVTNTDRKSGRGNLLSSTPIKKWADEKNINIFQVENLKNLKLINCLAQEKADLFLVIAYKILLPEIFNIPHYGTMNLHASLLPKYRGAAPIQRAILDGKKNTGISTFIIDEKIDRGKVVLQEKISISDKDNYSSLYVKLSNAGGDLVLRSINNLKNNLPLKNQEKESTYAKKINKNEFQIIWDESSKKIVNRIRAFSFSPGAYTNFRNKRIKILEAEITTLFSSTSDLKIGQIEIVDNKLYVKTKDSAVKINSLKLEGKKIISSNDFINGYLLNNRKSLKFEYK